MELSAARLNRAKARTRQLWKGTICKVEKMLDSDFPALERTGRRAWLLLGNAWLPREKKTLKRRVSSLLLLLSVSVFFKPPWYTFVRREAGACQPEKTNHSSEWSPCHCCAERTNHSREYCVVNVLYPPRLNNSFESPSTKRTVHHFDKHEEVNDNCLLSKATKIGDCFRKSNTVEGTLMWLASCDADLFPQLRLAAAIALTAPVQTADVERLFSALKLVKTPLRNRLKDDHLDICCRVAIDGPPPGTVVFRDLVKRFYRANRNRRVKCSKEGCDICV